MRYYAHFGHCDFIVCLGYQGDVIRQYFEEDHPGDPDDPIALIPRGCDEWNITFVDTGLTATIGERLHAVAPLLEGEELFLANYGDTLTDLHLPDLIDRVRASACVAGFLAVRPRYSFHILSIADDGLVGAVTDVTRSDMWVNGGYFVFRREILDHLGPGRDLVIEPFQELIARGELLAHRHDGFWAPMDTLKERQELEAAHAAGHPPWAVWQETPNGARV
jgi:glucose-1-phosphate cytidylyltransferase